MNVWQGVAMDSFHSGPTLLRPASGPYGRFMDDMPTERAACGRLLPVWTPYVYVAIISIDFRNRPSALRLV
jgi:hypothetical protein